MTLTADAAETADGGGVTTAPTRLGRRVRGRWWRAIHLWLGLLTAVGVIVVSVTGIVLNHTGAWDLGSKGPPAISGSGGFDDAAAVNDLLSSALLAADERGVEIRKPRGEIRRPDGPSDIDRATFRPGTATAQVRLRDPRHTEVILDWSDGTVLAVDERDDVGLSHLHSGETLGQRGVVLSDLVAVALVVLIISGMWVWVKRLRRHRSSGAAGDSRWVRANWWFHLVAGLAAATFTIVLCVTGVILNHKREWGFMVEPYRSLDAEIVARLEPTSLSQIGQWAIDARSPTVAGIDYDDIRFIDYRPSAGYAKVRFKDAETEVVVDVYDGEIYSIAHRRDIWIEDLHSGVRFGSEGVWLSDVTAGLLVLLTINGIFLWLRPAWSGRSRPLEG